MKFGVMAYRSNLSMFGSASAWCKHDGKEMEFDTIEEARKEANRLNAKATSVAVSYQAKEKE